jgi:hypothetical protein
MLTLGKWLAIAMGIYLAIAVVMNAVEPAWREKEARAVQVAAPNFRFVECRDVQ